MALRAPAGLPLNHEGAWAKGRPFLGGPGRSPRLLQSGPRAPPPPCSNRPAGFALVGLSAGFLPLSKSSRALHSSVLCEGLWNWIDQRGLWDLRWGRTEKPASR